MQASIRILTCTFLLLTGWYQVYGLGAGSSQTADKPNVILIMTDDQGYGDLGFHGNEIIRTPHMDALFRESVHASNFHVSPTCSPTRGALLTGRYTNRVGTWHTVGGRSLLFEDETTLAEVFARNGYATGMFGKWHLGDNYPFRPEDRGFQQTVRHGGGGVTQSPDYWGNDYFDDTFWFNGEPRKTEGYVTDLFFEESIAFIEANREGPFFAYISTNAPHGPFHVPERYYNLYNDRDDLLERQKRFYGMITNIDDNLGKLEERLAALGLTENTILIFLTDNGTAAGYSVRNGEVFGYNAGLRGTKNSEYDGGHRVPFAIRWPEAGIDGGREVSQLLAHIDLLPTLVDLAGLRFTPTKELDGRSFAPLLRREDAAWEHRTLIVDSQRIENLVKWRKSAVMDETWRLINGRELYRIGEDLAQRQDLADEYPEVVGRLRASYNRWWNSLQEQGVNERYAYIRAGTPYENPVRLSAHDMHILPFSSVWRQSGVLQGVPGKGVLKVEIAEEGRYKISLRRYPRESGLAFNERVSAREQTLEVNRPLPASRLHNLTHASLYLGDISQTKAIPDGGAEEVTFEGYLPAGKYDLMAVLKDEQGQVYPSYYTYIEKIAD